jgi:hypothetical protein
MGDDRNRSPCAAGPVRRTGASATGRAVLLAGTALVVVAVLAVAVPRERPDLVRAPAATASATASGAVEVLDLPTRGSLSGDASFLAGVLRLSWAAPESTVGPGIPDPPPETRRVAFAGEVPGGRWALVVGANALVPGVPPRPSDGRHGEHLAAAWFTGPPGASAEQLELRTVPRGVLPDQPAALVDPATGALVVVTAPGDVVEVSASPEVSAEGIALRTFRRVPAEAGVAVVALPPNDLLMTAVSYRVLRGGSEVVRTKPEPYPPRSPLLASVEYRRGLPPPAGQAVARRAATSVLARLGLPRAQVQATAEWVGDMPGPGGATGPAAVVTVRVPSGAVVVTAGWDLPAADGGRAGTRCSLAIQPAGYPTDRRVHAVRCVVEAVPRNSPARTTLVVVGPPQVALVRTHDHHGTFLTQHPAPGGVVVAPFPDGTATVEAVTGGGVSLGRWRLLGQVADFGS